MPLLKCVHWKKLNILVKYYLLNNNKKKKQVFKIDNNKGFLYRHRIVDNYVLNILNKTNFFKYFSEN